MPKGARFGRNSGDRCSMTKSERIASRGVTAQTHANNANTPTERRMRQAEADACERVVNNRRKSGQ